MSHLHPVGMETLTLKTEITVEEESDNTIFCKTEHFEEEFRDWNESLKLEDKFVVKEEIKEFINDQFIPKTESSIDKLEHDYLSCNKNDGWEETLQEESEIYKTVYGSSRTGKLDSSDSNSSHGNHHCTVYEEYAKLNIDTTHYICCVKTQDAKEKEYSCSDCDKTFIFQKELKIHKEEFHSSEKLECFYCSLIFNKKSDLKFHMQSHKAVVKHPHICDICSKVFNFQSNLVRHMKIHSGHKPYFCETCVKGFTRLDGLKIHKKMRKHQDLLKESGLFGNKTHFEETFDVEEFVCEICGKGFRIKQRLRDHLKLHTENRPHICPVCNRAFKQIYNLQQHVLSHDGPRDFICDICNKGFRRKAFLKQHMLVHTKEKKYACEMCGKRYYKSCHVTAHKRKAHSNPV